MKKRFSAPVPGLAVELLKETHILIGGSTGSGKSVLLTNLIYAALFHHEVTICDPKRVDFSRYRKACYRYSNDIPGIIGTLQAEVNDMEKRYRRMEKKGLQKYDGPQRWIFVDELADLMIQARKEVEPLLIRLAQLGRAAGIHLVLATQNPSRAVITAGIKLNMTCCIALRCGNTIESRMLIDTNDAVMLPVYGQALIKHPIDLEPERWYVHLVDPTAEQALIKYLA